MPLKDNTYDQGADDALKNCLEEINALITDQEELGNNDDYIGGLRDALYIIRTMRKELYT